MSWSRSAIREQNVHLMQQKWVEIPTVIDTLGTHSKAQKTFCIISNIVYHQYCHRTLRYTIDRTLNTLGNPSTERGNKCSFPHFSTFLFKKLHRPPQTIKVTLSAIYLGQIGLLWQIFANSKMASISNHIVHFGKRIWNSMVLSLRFAIIWNSKQV